MVCSVRVCSECSEEYNGQIACQELNCLWTLSNNWSPGFPPPFQCPVYHHLLFVLFIVTVADPPNHVPRKPIPWGKRRRPADSDSVYDYNEFNDHLNKKGDTPIVGSVIESYCKSLRSHSVTSQTNRSRSRPSSHRSSPVGLDQCPGIR